MEFYYFILKFLKRIYLFFFSIKQRSLIFNTKDAQIASNKIYNLLASDKPCMIARFGANESNVLQNSKFGQYLFGVDFSTYTGNKTFFDDFYSKKIEKLV